jgi:hypothetical protein
LYFLFGGAATAWQTIFDGDSAVLAVAAPHLADRSCIALLAPKSSPLEKDKFFEPVFELPFELLEGKKEAED